MKRVLKIAAVVFAFVLISNVSVVAQRSWDGGNGTLIWSDAGNWSPDGNVLFNEDVLIGNLLSAANDTTIYDVATASRLVDA